MSAEYQPPDSEFEGVYVARHPMYDAELSPQDYVAALRMSSLVDAVRGRGGKALVTCWAGLNRSGLVSALSLIYFDEMLPDEAIRAIQAKRLGALYNWSFLSAIRHSGR